VELVPRYERPVLELVPVVFGIYRADVPQFGVEDGVIVRRAEDEFRMRVGSMLAINILSFTEDESVYVGICLGVGLLGEGETVSDLLAGSLLSYRDVLRLGLGVGLSELPVGLMGPLKEGEPLPTNVDDLEEVTRTAKKLTFALTFNLTGFDLPIVD
jgi:hypothetical protein